eukprot:324292-Rhodomonas_salina.1
MDCVHVNTTLEFKFSTAAVVKHSNTAAVKISIMNITVELLALSSTMNAAGTRGRRPDRSERCWRTDENLKPRSEAT